MTVPEITRSALLVAARAAEEKMAEDIVAFDVAERLGLGQWTIPDHFSRFASMVRPPIPLA